MSLLTSRRLGKNGTFEIETLGVQKSRHKSTKKSQQTGGKHSSDEENLDLNSQDGETWLVDQSAEGRKEVPVRRPPLRPHFVCIFDTTL